MLLGRQLAEGNRAGAPACFWDLRGLATHARGPNTRQCTAAAPRSSQQLGQPRPTRRHLHCWCNGSGATAAGSPDANSSQEVGPFTAADRAFMAAALEQAYAGAAADEVPIGAVLVVGDRIIAAAHNRTHALRSPLAHAEMLCLAKGSSRLRSWRLLDATLYVTLEPCPMCAGALLQARVARVVYGARQPRVGADGSWVQLFPRREPASGAAPAGGFRSAAINGTGGGANKPEGNQAPTTGSCRSPGANSCGSRGSSHARGEGQSSTLKAERDPGVTEGKPSPSDMGPSSASSPSSCCAGSHPARPHPFHNSVVVHGGCRAEECADVVRAFFRRRRQQRQAAAAAPAAGPGTGSRSGLGTGTLSDLEEFG